MEAMEGAEYFILPDDSTRFFPCVDGGGACCFCVAVVDGGACFCRVFWGSVVVVPCMADRSRGCGELPGPEAARAGGELWVVVAAGGRIGDVGAVAGRAGGAAAFVGEASETIREEVVLGNGECWSRDGDERNDRMGRYACGGWRCS